MNEGVNGLSARSRKVYPFEAGSPRDAHAGCAAPGLAHGSRSRGNPEPVSPVSAIVIPASTCRICHRRCPRKLLGNRRRMRRITPSIHSARD